MTETTHLRPGSPRPTASGGSGGWARVARTSGWAAGSALAATTVLYLLDATDALSPSPVFQRTSGGLLADEADWYVAFFHRQHEILWSIVARDLVGPAGFVALAVLALTVVRLTGFARPSAVVAALLVTVGSMVHVVSDLAFLGQLSYWRETGWSPDPPVLMVTIGRASEALDHTTTYLEAVSYLILAAGLVALGSACRSELRLPSWLGTVAVVEAAGLVVLFLGIALQQDILFQVAGGATGVVLGPLFAVALGRHLGSELAAVGGQRGAAEPVVTARA